MKYSTFSNDKADFKVLNWLSKYAEINKNINITVKLHPSENIKKFKIFMRRDENKIVFVEDGDTDMLPVASTAFIGRASELATLQQ